MTVLEVQSFGSTASAGYRAITTTLLRHIGNAGVDFFVQYDPNGPMILYHRADHPIETRDQAALLGTGIRQIFVRANAFPILSEHLLKSVELFVDDEAVPPAERFATLQVAMALEMEQAIRSPTCESEVALAEKIGGMLVSLLQDNRVLPIDLFRLARHDACTFTHVTNVGGYSVLLAKRMGISDATVLERIAVGALLHDFGKRLIPTAILQKPSRLEPHERKIIETHPTRGYEALWQRSDLGQDQLMMVYQHHERIDGKGYPVGVIEDEIHPLAKMLSVIDVFDAMTGTRPYRRSASPRSALDWIQENSGTQFDLEAVQCWSAAMSDA